MRNIANLKTVKELKAYANSLGVDLPCDETIQTGPDALLAQPCRLSDKTIGNRFAILPMEGWDATSDGLPTDLTVRRWQRFGSSGAKLIFGGEAVAVRHDGKESPNQLVMSENTVNAIGKLRESLVSAHKDRIGRTDDLLVGLQLTHSGRTSRPHSVKQPEPIILYHHPLLDEMFGIEPNSLVLTDEEIDSLIEKFVKASVLSYQAGFDFVDIKLCHGYLGHEFLSAVNRPGRYGGSFENRTRFLHEIVKGIRAHAPQLDIAVRLSAFDFLPFEQGPNGRGKPVPFAGDTYPYAFGGDGSGLGINLNEPLTLLDVLDELNIKLVCISAGSSFYNHHILRPAIKASLDTYKPPEDPLIAVARQISVTAELKNKRPQFIYVGSAYSYLQQWLPNVAQGVVRSGMADSIGIGRMALSYPEIVVDILEGKPLKRKFLCRTCGDCTTAPRNGLVSGCYLLDKFYRSRPEYQQLKHLKSQKTAND